MPIFIVTYKDDEGPYAVAFSTRALAQAFIDSFPRRRGFTLIETMLDQAAVLVKA